MAQEIANLKRETKVVIDDKENEIQSLRARLEHFSQATMEEVMETKRQMESTTKELESHKSKRLAARTEMINVAKVRFCTTLFRSLPVRE
jgi:prefoldin subunit 5